MSPSTQHTEHTTQNTLTRSTQSTPPNTEIIQNAGSTSSTPNTEHNCGERTPDRADWTLSKEDNTNTLQSTWERNGVTAPKIISD